MKRRYMPGFLLLALLYCTPTFAQSTVATISNGQQFGNVGYNPQTNKIYLVVNLGNALIESMVPHYSKLRSHCRTPATRSRVRRFS
jgi:hypothetical protein